MDALTSWDWLWILFIGFWVGVLIWIKGTNPMSSTFWHVLWIIVKVPLYICGGIIAIALLFAKR